MQYTNTAPIPLFDTLEYLGNDSIKQRAQAFFSEFIPEQAINKEYQLACDFLYSYRGSQATFNAYRREVERLIHWAWAIAKKPLCEIRRQDFELYLDFCQAPPASWIGTKQVSRFKTLAGERVANPDWHPFVATVSKVAHRNGLMPKVENYCLSQKALQAIFAITSSFFTYLIQEEYMDHNPVAMIRQKSKYIRKEQSQKVVRRLSELQWGYVIETAKSLAKENPEQHERGLFIMNILYGMYLRISELTASERWTPTMGDFYRDNDGSWWFITVGKGNKQRDVSVSNEMLDSFKRYRTSLGLTPLPSPGDPMPLLMKSRGKGPITSTRHIRMIVQNCFDKAISRLEQDGFNEEADQLAAATVHWLRHTGISEDVKVRPREHVRDDAGHGSSAITDKYIDIERRERHASARDKIIDPLTEQEQQ